MNKHTLRLSCEVLEGRDLPTPVAGVRPAPVIPRPAPPAPAVLRPPVVVPTPAPTPGTMAAPNKFGDAVETIGLNIGLTVTAVKTGLEVLRHEATGAVDAFGHKADLAALIGPAIDTLNKTGSGVHAAAAVAVNWAVQIQGNAAIQRVATVAAVAFPQYRVTVLVAGGVLSMYFTYQTTQPALKQAIEQWSIQFGDWLQSALGGGPSNGLIPSTRAAPRIIVPSGR